MKNRFKIRFADNGVIVEQPDFNILEVIEYGEGDDSNGIDYAPIERYLGKEITEDFREAQRQNVEALGLEIEIKYKPIK